MPKGRISSSEDLKTFRSENTLVDEHRYPSVLSRDASSRKQFAQLTNQSQLPLVRAWPTRHQVCNGEEFAPKNHFIGSDMPRQLGNHMDKTSGSYIEKIPSHAKPCRSASKSTQRERLGSGHSNSSSETTSIATQVEFIAFRGIFFIRLEMTVGRLMKMSLT